MQRLEEDLDVASLTSFKLGMLTLFQWMGMNESNE